MRILLFWDLNYEFNTHAHTRTILNTIDFEFDAHLAFSALAYLVADTHTHTRKMFLVNEFEFNTNTYTLGPAKTYKMGLS